MADSQNSLSMEGFIKQQIADIDAVITEKDEAFKERNKVHFNEIAALKAKQLPFRKLLRDFENAKSGIVPNKGGRKKKEAN